jgi:hypothetical protein
MKLNQRVIVNVTQNNFHYVGNSQIRIKTSE